MPSRSALIGRMAKALVCVLLVAGSILAVSAARRDVIYNNEFAVHVPGGRDAADRIAEKHGFINVGQIGSLKGYYLMTHHNVHKRSLNTSQDHHQRLHDEPEVHWVQQQHERRRLKRDYVQPLPPRGYNSWQPAPAAAIAREPIPSHRPRYRALSSPNRIFPDPLFREQWYMNGGAKDGLDMNVGPAWQKGYTGKGVVVSILDDGIQTNHPDLAQNYDAAASTDINGNDDDPMPVDDGDNKHGTRCAGEVAAVAFNIYCGIGVAYNASIGGVRMLDGVVNDAVEARALGLNPDHIDIYSASWGPEDDGKTVDGPGPLARRAFIYGVTSGRGGKGSIFVWASGNGGRHTDSCNCDGYTNSIFTLSISSATQGGYKPWYLEECSSTLASTYSSGTPGHDKSVATVDMDGRLRPDHICTVEHTGTSASAPLAAGICALALEANPALTWRDMQYLVVMTSRAAPLEKETGWIVNGVKRKVSHKFGYGLMDAGGMVALAEQWNIVPPQHICKSKEINEDQLIDSTYGFTMTMHMDVNGCSGTVNEVRFLEHVQCKISLRFFPRGNLRILLTSPMGTTSTLLFERPRDVVSSNFDEWPFLSVHFWGEKAEGRWTLQVVNAGNRHVNQHGVLKKWQLIFYGTSSNPIRVNSQGSNIDGIQSAIPFAFPTTSDGTLHSPSGGDGQYYNTDLLNSNFQNYPNIYTAAGSEQDKVMTSLDGHNIPTAQRENVMADSNNKRVLHSCDPECDQQGCYGKGPTQCVACKFYRLDNTCVSRCPPRSFPNQGGVCWPCHESCETCAGAGQDSCLACAPAHLRVTDLAVCLQQCPDGYYENFDQNTCVPCSANCGSCQDRPDMCLSCDHHLVMHENKCFAACPQFTYETEDYNCASCHSTCETCNGSSETQCISCRSGKYSLDGKCLSSCPDSYYADKKRRECLTCPLGCATCNSALCLTCDPQWTLNKKGKCVPEGSNHCDQSEYFSDNHCRGCHSTCETCNGGADSSCLSCPPPLLLEGGSCVAACTGPHYQEAGICARCLHTCSACVSRLNCTSCEPGLKLQSGECRASCAPGYYSDRGLCSKCYLSCQTCSGPRRDQCVNCPSGWQLAAGECHPECPEGFFKSDFGCQKCHHYCRNCHGEGPLKCTSCPPHFMLDGGLCMECLGSQYYDTPTQLCRTCHDSCRSCSGPGAFSCVACTYPLRLDRLNNQCVPCCAENAVPTSDNTTTATGVGGVPIAAPGDCCKCDKDTGGCQNSSPAGKRRIAVSAERAEAFHQLGARGGVSPPRMAVSGPSNTSSSAPLFAFTALAIAACLCVTLAFAVIFLVLQRRSRPMKASGGGRGGVSYAPLASQEDGQGLPGIQLKSSRLAVSVDETQEHDADTFSDDGEETKLVART